MPRLENFHTWFIRDVHEVLHLRRGEGGGLIIGGDRVAGYLFLDCVLTRRPTEFRKIGTGRKLNPDLIRVSVLVIVLRELLA
jgi:hypothetical protein